MRRLMLCCVRGHVVDLTPEEAAFAKTSAPLPSSSPTASEAAQTLSPIEVLTTPVAERSLPITAAVALQRVAIAERKSPRDVVAVADPPLVPTLAFSAADAAPQKAASPRVPAAAVLPAAAQAANASAQRRHSDSA